jgi:hypothetical protein
MAHFTSDLIFLTVSKLTSKLLGLGDGFGSGRTDAVGSIPSGRGSSTAASAEEQVVGHGQSSRWVRKALFTSSPRTNLSNDVRCTNHRVSRQDLLWDALAALFAWDETQPLSFSRSAQRTWFYAKVEGKARIITKKTYDNLLIDSLFSTHTPAHAPQARARTNANAMHTRACMMPFMRLRMVWLANHTDFACD